MRIAPVSPPVNLAGKNAVQPLTSPNPPQPQSMDPQTMQAGMRLVGQMQGGVTPPVMPSVPLTPDPTTQAVVDGRLPVATNGPIPGKSLDWEGEANRVADEMFSVSDGDDVASISSKIRGRSAFISKLKDLANSYGRPPSNQEVRAIGRAFYEDKMGGAQPMTPTFSPESQKALESAFGVTPEHRIAQIDNVPKEQLIALAGRGIANMLLGRGSFGDALRDVHFAVDAQQPGLDALYQKQLQEAEANRQLNLAKYGRITQLEDAADKRKEDLQDYELQQQGYEARDERTAQRQHDLQMDILNRQEKGAADAQEKAVLMTMMNMLPYLDSGRIQALGKFYESQTGKQLPPEFYAMAPTAKEDATRAGVGKTFAETANVQARTEGQKLKNQFDAKTLDDRAKAVGVNLETARVSLDTLRAKLKGLPDQIAADIAYKHAMAVATLQRAQAALISAKRPRVGSGDPNLKGLIALQQGLDRDYTNYAQKLQDLTAEKEGLEAGLDKADYAANSDDATIDQKTRPVRMRARLRKVAEEIAKVQNKAEERAKQMSTTTDSLLHSVKQTDVTNKPNPVQGKIGGKK